MTELRVFPRITSATPLDDGARHAPPQLWEKGADRVLVSVTFDDDRRRGEWLADQWRPLAGEVVVGGPAYDDPAGEFVPGRFLKRGYTITSRGCPNRCWFCDAWKREGHAIRELTIHDGHDLLDNNILACSENHIRSVFQMLGRQATRARLTGGLEAARLRPWHVDLLTSLNPRVAFFAYDEPDDREPIHAAAAMLEDAGLIRPTSHAMCCYVLIGYGGDSLAAANARLEEVAGLGLFPQAMLLDIPGKGRPPREADDERQWRRLRWEWSNKVVVGHKMTKAETKVGKTSGNPLTGRKTWAIL